MDNLSPQMRRVLMLLAAGNTNKEIASILGIKRETVRRYAYKAMDRMKARTVMQAVIEFMVNYERQR